MWTAAAQSRDEVYTLFEVTFTKNMIICEPQHRGSVTSSSGHVMTSAKARSCMRRERNTQAAKGFAQTCTGCFYTR